MVRAEAGSGRIARSVDNVATILGAKGQGSFYSRRQKTC
jgi:hypothetical protein